MPSKQTAEFTDRISKKSTQETLEKLRQIGGQKLTQESGVGYHTTSKQILLPEGMSLKQGAKLITAQAMSMEEVHGFNKVFRFRPWDGAYAMQETLKELFGLGGQGRAIHTFFGSTPPQYINIEVGIGQEVRVPWGHIDFPPFEGMFITGVSMDPTYGALFQLTAQVPKKYEAEVEGLFVAIEDTLRRKSIYKGKAIVGVGRVTRDGFENPSFLDPYAIDPEKVAYKQEVFDRLDASVWGMIRTAELQRKAGMKLNKKTLLYGPYGTGKSLAGGLTARTAVDNGWTFIQTKSGDEELSKVLATAQLYAPAVVFIEDIDTLINADSAKMSELLELFDGIGSKNSEVMVLMTSNHADSLSKGMTRVGRIDAAIEIGDLDRAGIERLVTTTFSPSQLADDIDFDEVVESMRGYEPAFIMGTFNLTKSNAIIRSGSLDFQLTTADFVLAADTLRNQHDTHSNAQDRPAVDKLGSVLSGTLADVLKGHKVDLDSEGELVSLT